MIRTLAMVTLFGLLATGSPGHAQSAVEDALSTDLEYRGQGRAALCYAFAEEQVLKDFSCTENCAYDAARWTYSIFDLARAHQERFFRQTKRSEANRARDLFLSGSYFAFPYPDVGVSSVRASKCTLEKEIFFLNRSKITNPPRGDVPRDDMVTYLGRLYRQFKANPSAPPPIGGSEIGQAWTALAGLAAEAKNDSEFMTRVIDFTKCNDRIAIPLFKVRVKAAADPATLSTMLKSQLLRGHSLYVGVCAEVLANQELGPEDCARHAVVLRRYDPKTNQILVVDSAFFSRGPRIPDGSTWMGAAVVRNAVLKSQRDYDRIVAEARASANNEARGRDFGREARQLVGVLKQSLAGLNTRELKIALLESLRGTLATLPPGHPHRVMYKKIIARAYRMTFHSPGDLDQLTPLYERFARDAVHGADGGRDLPPSGIIWLESPNSRLGR